MTLSRVDLASGADLDGFRRAVRVLVHERVPPERVVWNAGDAPMLLGETVSGEAPPVPLPRKIGELIEIAVCHRDPERYALLYALVWRVLGGERELLSVHSDPLVHRLALIAKSVHRDLHKMHAFLRFRRIEDERGERFVAWFEPDHHILEAAAPFFVDRFRGMAWSILTPEGSLHWDRETLTRGPPTGRRDPPGSDSLEAMWRGYYESTFNPARANPDLMRQHMPKKYWRNLPETQAIPGMVRAAPARAAEMIARVAQPPRKRDPAKAVAAMAEQEPKTLAELNAIIARAEPLVPGATRAVLGEGPAGAAIAFVGEQPGDQEDLAGRPFVGPAGHLLDRALAEAGLDRAGVYVTNAVKHFKFAQRGKKRIHQKPTMGEVQHYRWWLKKELELVRPRLVVALGGTAALALTGRAVSVTHERGQADFGGRRGYITVHPSYLLRLPDEEAKRRAYAEFVGDLARVRVLAAGEGKDGFSAAAE